MALIEYHPPLEPYLDIIYQDNHICVVNNQAVYFQFLAINLNTMTVL